MTLTLLSMLPAPHANASQTCEILTADLQHSTSRALALVQGALLIVGCLVKQLAQGGAEWAGSAAADGTPPAE